MGIQRQRTRNPLTFTQLIVKQVCSNVAQPARNLIGSFAQYSGKPGIQTSEPDLPGPSQELGGIKPHQRGTDTGEAAPQKQFALGAAQQRQQNNRNSLSTCT